MPPDAVVQLVGSDEEVDDVVPVVCVPAAPVVCVLEVAVVCELEVAVEETLIVVDADVVTYELERSNV